MALNPKQQLFAAEYIANNFNGTKAAIAAGYAESNARKTASDLLDNVEIQEAIAQAIEARTKRTGITADWVLRRLAEEADADIGDILDDNGNLLPLKQWPAIFRKGLVSGFDIEEKFEGSDRKKTSRLCKIKLIDRTKTIELIGKHTDVAAFRERHIHTGMDDGPIKSEVSNVTPEQLAEAVRTVRDDY